MTAAKGRVYRGGSWIYDATGCRSADRNINEPGLRLNSVGFRVSQVADD